MAFERDRLDFGDRASGLPGTIGYNAPKGANATASDTVSEVRANDYFDNFGAEYDRMGKPVIRVTATEHQTASEARKMAFIRLIKQSDGSYHSDLIVPQTS